MRQERFPNKVALLFFIIIGFWTVSGSCFERLSLKNQIDHYSLGSHLSYLEDRQAAWSIDDIRNPLFFGQWQQNITEVPAFGYTSSVYWFAIELESSEEIPIERILALTYPQLDSVDIYLDRNGQIVDHFHAGDKQPFAHRPIEHRHFLFPVSLSHGERTTLYLRVQTTSSMQVPLDLWSESVFWTADQRTLIVQGMYFGIMLVMVLYNLFIYSTIQDRSYLYYVLFVSCFCILQLRLQGFGYHYFWPQHPRFNEFILITSVCITLMFGGLFTISFLELKKQINKLYRVILLTISIAVINAIFSLVFDYQTAIYMALANSLVMTSFSLASGCIMWRRGYAPARYYTIAWMGFLIGAITFVLSKIGVMPRTSLTENGMQLGSATEVLLLSLALANRINTIRKEKELAQAETVTVLKKYHALYENAIEGIFQITLGWNFVSVNRAMLQMFGFSNQEILLSDHNCNLRNYFVNENKADQFAQELKETGEVIGYEFKAKRSNSSEFWAAISIRMVHGENGQPIHYEGLFMDITEKRETQQQVRHMAYYDNVTGLPNRALLQDLLEHAIDRAKRSDERVAVLFVDLNRFKLVNDTLGHDAGDRLLQEVGNRLGHCLRGGDWVGMSQSLVADEPEGALRNTVARLGGDEFVMVITDIRHDEDAAIVARRVGELLEQTFIIDGKEVYISASIGISIYPKDSDNPDTLLKQADAAMYQIKKQGINGYQFHDDFLSAHASKRLALETELRNALSNNEFQLCYQPKVDLKSGLVVGVEALCRWRHPKRSMILPNEFIELAEETGLIIAIGEWVLATACLENKRWQDAGLPALQVSVNLSARQFNDPGLTNKVLSALHKSGLESRYLELELTESILMDDTQAAGKLLKDLKDIGVNISVDDFGTGYSSLSYLKRFPVDALKIDRCFVRDITQDADDQAITAAIISMARQLGLKVIAEGVETEAQLFYLREQKCDEIQGYFVSAPLSVEQFTRFLEGNEKSRYSIPTPSY